MLSSPITDELHLVAQPVGEVEGILMRSDSSIEYEQERQEKSYDNYNHLIHCT